MAKTNWDSVIDVLQAAMVWFVIVVVVLSVCALILFDVLVGAGSMYNLTQGKLWIAFVISLATTGLLMSLMFIGYQLSTNKSQSAKNIGYGVAFAAFLVYCLDVYFDAMTADILRFGNFTSTHEINHMLFRGLLGGISTIGEAMAISIIIGMPVLKTIINNAIPESYRRYQTPAAKRTYEQTIPSSIPRQTQTTRPAPKPRVEKEEFDDEPTFHPMNYGG